MIPIGKTVKISNNTLLTIPVSWRDEMNLEKGNLVKMYIRNSSVIITECNQYSTEITSTIGKCGQIYIPIEVCNYFRFKKVKTFNVFIDKVKKNIILMPYD